MARANTSYISPIKSVAPNTSWKSQVNVEMIITLERFSEVTFQLNRSEPIAVDTETTGLDYDLLKIVGFSFSQKGKGYYVPLNHKLGVNAPAECAKIFVDFLISFEKVLFYNFSFDGRVLRKLGLDLEKVKAFDVMPLVWNVDTNIHMPSLKESAKTFCGIESETYSEKWGGVEDVSFVSPEQLAEYAAYDSIFTEMLYFRLRGFYEKSKFIVDLDNALIKAMIFFEDTPIKIDLELAKKFQIEISKRIKEVEAEVFQMVGRPFKIGSPHELSNILTSLGINTGTFTKTGQMSTEADELEKLSGANPVLDKIVLYKKLVKKLSTYVDPFVENFNSDIEGVRFSYQTCNVPTARMSSGVRRASKSKGKERYFAPVNVQSIPKSGSKFYKVVPSEDGIFGSNFVQDDEGKFESYEREENVRRFFVPHSGHYVVAIDFSQEELIIAANLTKEQAVLAPIKNGEDVHEKTARALFPEKQYDKSLRKIAKIATYALLFGGNEVTLKQQMPDKSEEECKEIYERWLAVHRTLVSFRNKESEKARVKGCCESIFGRVRRLAYWFSTGSPRDYSFAKRTVFSQLIQGSAAEVMRIALVRIHKFLVKNPEHQQHLKFMGSLHDELVFSITKDEKIFNILMDKIVNSMTEIPFKWEVPLTVDISVGKSWGEVFAFTKKDGKWTPSPK